MSNPPLLLCDSDVLVQLFIANELRPLVELKKSYGIQPAIALEVDIELRWMSKHKDRFVQQLDKALKSETLKKLDQALFHSLLGGAKPGTSWAGFQTLGAQYYGYIQRGEAYTHAAGVTLSLPVASNDFSAIQTLQAQMLTLPVPIIRSFDLLVFSYGAGILELKECDAARKELLKNNEGLPKAFRNSSFEDGMRSFSCRLVDGSSGASPPPSTFSSVLTISRI
jgi:hypothetical protein